MDECGGSSRRGENVDYRSRCLIADLDASATDQVGPVDALDHEGVEPPR
jgi:hypothetical protein